MNHINGRVVEEGFRVNKKKKNRERKNHGGIKAKNSYYKKPIEVQRDVLRTLKKVIISKCDPKNPTERLFGMYLNKHIRTRGRNLKRLYTLFDTHTNDFSLTLEELANISGFNSGREVGRIFRSMEYVRPKKGYGWKKETIACNDGQEKPKGVGGMKKIFMYEDNLATYHGSYRGLTRGALKNKDKALYERMWRDGSLEHVPLANNYETTTISLEEKINSFCDNHGLDKSLAKERLVQEGIDVQKEYVLIRGRPEVDELVDEGLSYQKIGDQVGFSKQRASNVIKNSRQYDFHRVMRRVRNILEKEGLMT